MVEYVTKQEVFDILNDIQMEATREEKDDAVHAATEAMKRVKALYAVRSNVFSSWKIIGTNRDVIYCGNCAFKTLAYKNSAYCPNCGRTMMNGVRR